MLTRSTHTEIGLSKGVIGIFKLLVYIENEEECNSAIDLKDTTIFPPDTIYVRNPLYILIELINPKPLLLTYLKRLSQSLLINKILKLTFQKYFHIKI